MKKFRDILSDMSSWVFMSSSKVTNFSVGSVIRSILEAVAMEIEDMYLHIRTKFSQLQDNAIYNSFGFARKPAIAATGFVTIKFIQPLAQSVLFKQGHKFYTVPLEGKTVYFETTEDVTVPMGYSEYDLPLICTEAGTIGNVPAYSITRTVNYTPFIGGIYNKNKFFTGMPEETKEARQKRFGEFIGSLGRSSNPALIYGCSQVEGITGVHIKEDIGMIYVYAHDAFGNLNDQLRTDLENQLHEYKSGGVKALISTVTKKPVDLTIDVLIASGYPKSSLLYKIEEEVTVYLNKMQVAKPLVYAHLVRFILDIHKEAIENIDLNVGDVPVEEHELIRPGVILVREMGS